MPKSNKDNRLGKGLNAIFGEDVSSILADIESGAQETKSNGGAKEIRVDEIRPNPYQPRMVFDPVAIKELASSIKEHGVFNPIIIRKSVQGYELIAGERRLRASKEAGLETIPSIIVDFNDEQMMEISILENIQREDLTPIEEANAYKKLQDNLGYTQEVLAQRVGKTREYVANMMRLLKLPSSIQKLVQEKKISMGAVRPLVTIEDEDLQNEIAQKIISEGLSVREVEKLVKEYGNGESPLPKKKIHKEKDPNLTYVENLMELKLQTMVVVDKKQICIKYTSDKDLNRILELLGLIEE